jgi:CRISPR-associated protein Cas5h
MKILKFSLEGKTAFFKKPDVNTYVYFTYGNIHKISLLGIFGAILGYKGYNQMKNDNSLRKSNKKNSEDIVFPEFYSRLQNIKISISPKNKNGFIPKKVQIFNNSVGYASKEQGGNLIIKEQWLENPAWDIYLLVDNEESEKISEYILNNKCVYQPYLGKNDHYANIKEAELLEEIHIKEVKDIDKIDSLCPKKLFEIDLLADEPDDFSDEEIVENFKYEEQLPIGLDENTNMYILENLLYTNMKLINKDNITIYKVQNKNIAFF